MDCLAKLDIVPFYRHKRTFDNAWLTGISSPYLWTKFLMEGSRTTCIERLTFS
jgi:hypothetical protein